MRTFVLVLLVGLLAVAILPATAAPNTRDDFNYLVGSNLTGQDGGIGWASAWASSIPGSFTITSPGLVFPGTVTSGLAVSAGNFGASNQTSRRQTTLPYGTANSVTNFAFLIRPDANFGQWGSMQINNVQVGLLDLAGRKLFIQDGINPQVAVPYNFVAGSTYLVQGALSVNNAGAATMQAWVWSSNAGWDTTVSTPLTGVWSGYTTVMLNSSSYYTYDEFYFGDRPNDPVPEAGTMVALGSFLSMGGLFLRRRFAKS